MAATDTESGLTRPETDAEQAVSAAADSSESTWHLPGTKRTRRRVLLIVSIGAVLLLMLYIGVPNLAGLKHTWSLIEKGDPAWLALALAVEVPSYAGLAFVLSAVVQSYGADQFSTRDSWRITLAGAAATRFLGAAGTGGIAVTLLGLRKGGLTARQAGAAQAAQLAVTYAWFLVLMGVSGFACYLFRGQDAAISLLPALVSIVALSLVAAVAAAPARFTEQLDRRRQTRWAQRLLAVPAAIAEGVRDGMKLIRERPGAAVGGFAWWAFDIASLWAAFHAFGAAPDVPELVLGYFVGQVANVLPIPGGVGAEGGITGALVALGQPAGLSLVAVLAYRFLSVWVPALPGALALTQLNKTGQHA